MKSIYIYYLKFNTSDFPNISISPIHIAIQSYSYTARAIYRVMSEVNRPAIGFYDVDLL